MAHSTEMFPVEVDPFFVEDLEQMSRAVNYRRWQFEMVKRYVTGQVLEIGGGIGNFTPDLASVAKKVTSVEPNGYCFARLKEATRELKNVSIHQATVESLEKQIPVLPEFDTVIMMNVLEHIQDDLAVCRELLRRLKPTGRLVLLVPAGQWAFGSTDERLGHYRRYSKGSLRRLYAQLNLRMEALRYYNFIGVWAWWWNAKMTRRHNQNDSQIRLFDRWFVPVISRVESMVPPPLGQSILAVGTPTAA